MIASPNAMPSGSAGAIYGGFIGYHTHPCKGPFYGVDLQAMGGVPPYSWSWAAAPGSVVPPGLSVTHTWIFLYCIGPIDFRGRFFDTISGTPTTAGTYNIVVTVSDSEMPAIHASMPYTITIH
jgi:hypothetical protein